ncbi:MAG: hypothetical protein P8J14_13220 [Emcibacteraceae bacterium]|nr:hypothetical protein [Emcibacteraceae bacterium]
MFLSKDTEKFIEERNHYVRRNALDADALNDFHFNKIAESADVSLDKVLADAKAYNIDLKHHTPS